MGNKTGILYKWRHRDGYQYVGKTTQGAEKRWQNHKNMLSMETHHCKALQVLWYEDGEDAFEMIESKTDVPLHLLDKEEQRMLDDIPYEYILNSARLTGAAFVPKMLPPCHQVDMFLGCLRRADPSMSWELFYPYRSPIDVDLIKVRWLDKVYCFLMKYAGRVNSSQSVWLLGGTSLVALDYAQFVVIFHGPANDPGSVIKEGRRLRYKDDYRRLAKVDELEWMEDTSRGFILKEVDYLLTEDNLIRALLNRPMLDKRKVSYDNTDSGNERQR